MGTQKGVGVLVGLATIAVGGLAGAMTLPDTKSSCAVTGECLKITNGGQSFGDRAITAVSYDDAITALSAHGKGVLGHSSTGHGVVGSTDGSPSGYGVWGLSAVNTGVNGSTTATTGGVAGVRGAIGSSADETCAAILGDAASSWTVWAGTFIGDIQARGLYQTSDARLKKDIKDGAYGLPELMKLRPVSYKWKEGTDALEHNGFLAQNVQAVFPSSVRTGGKAGTTLTVDYSSLVPVAVKAIQQQQTTIAQLEARIAELERRATPLAASVLPGGTSLYLALLPFGVFVAHRRYKRRIRGAD